MKKELNLKSFKKAEKLQIKKIVGKAKRLQFLVCEIERINLSHKSKTGVFEVEILAELNSLVNFFKNSNFNYEAVLKEHKNILIDQILKKAIELSEKSFKFKFGLDVLYASPSKRWIKITHQYYRKFTMLADVLTRKINNGEIVAQYQVDELSFSSFLIDLLPGTYINSIKFQKLTNLANEIPRRSNADFSKECGRISGIQNNELSKWIVETVENRKQLINQAQLFVDKEFLEILDRL